MDILPKTDKENGQEIGTLFSLIAVGIGLLPVLFGEPVRALWVEIGFVLLFLSVFMPRILAPVHSVWMKFALALGKITTPIVLGILFFIIFMPVGLYFRITGKDPLRVSRADAEGKASFWLGRDDNVKTSMGKQF